MVEYFCPYCDEKTYNGPIGWHNMGKHVESAHPEMLAEFADLDKEDYAMYKKHKRIIEADEPEETMPKPKSTAHPPVEIEAELASQAMEDTSIGDDDLEQMLKDAEQEKQLSKPQNIQQNTQTQRDVPIQLPDRILPPYDNLEEPEQWLYNLLTKSYGLNHTFSLFQLQKLKETGVLPYPTDLMSDIQSMNSGEKNPKTIQYIGNFYYSALQKYLQKRGEQSHMPPYLQPMGYNVSGNPQNPQQNAMMGQMGMRGIPVQQAQGDPQMYQMMQQQPMNPYQQPNPYQQQQNPQNNPMYLQMQEQMKSLQEELRRRDEESRRKLEQEVLELKSRPRDDSKMTALESQLKIMEEERRRSTEDKLRQIEQKAMNTSSPEQLSQFINQAIERERTRVTAEDVKRDMEQRMRELVNMSHGNTQAEVDMKRADNELQLGLERLKSDSGKTEMWGKTIESAAGIVGSSIGQVIAGQPPGEEENNPPAQQTSTDGKPIPQTPTQMPYLPENLPTITCEKCGANFGVPPNVEKGQCPNCLAPITVPNGLMDEIQKKQDVQPMTPSQSDDMDNQIPEYAKQSANEYSVNEPSIVDSELPDVPFHGVCAGCGIQVTDDTFGRQEGRKVLCKKCANAFPQGE